MDTTPALPDWERPYFKQPGNQNLFYYVVYGEINSDFNIPGDTYRVVYKPEIQLQAHRVSDEPDMVSQFRNDFFADMLKAQHPELVDTVNAQTHCYVVQALFPDGPELNDFRSVIGLITYLLDSGCIAVLDPLARQWWPAKVWHEKIFTPETFSPSPHVTIATSPEHNDTQWVHTLGMRKFGRPDLSVHYVTEEEMQGVLEMVNRFIGFMAHGGTIEEGQAIKMASLPSGMKCTHRGNFEDPDFNNVHVEILWPEPG